MTIPPTFIRQEATPSFARTARLEELVLWDFAFAVYCTADLTFEITWNGARTVSYTMSAEKVDGVARLLIVAESGAAPIIRGEEAQTIEDLLNPAIHTIVFERLDVREVQSARVSAEEAALPEIAPSIEVGETVTIENASGSIASDLASFFDALLAPSQIEVWPIEIRGYYAYTLDVVPITVPVVLVQRHDVSIRDATFFEQISSIYDQWFADAQPPARDARAKFEITIWSPRAESETPLLHLGDVSLPFTRP
ncbi:MAG: hypothetical protein ACJ74H_02730 [Thermoanaerobaculia bacterium]